MDSSYYIEITRFGRDVLKGRCLSASEIETLLEQGNTSSNWANVLITKNDDEAADLCQIRNCHFSGMGNATIVIGEQVGYIEYEENGAKRKVPCGLYNSQFFGSCTILDACLVMNTARVENVYMKPRSVILSCGSVLGPSTSSSSSKVLCDTQGDVSSSVFRADAKTSVPSPTTTFGNNSTICVGPENGGRNVILHIAKSFDNICREALKLEEPARELDIESLQCVLCSGSIVSHCGLIKDCFIGPQASVSHSDLDTCTLASTAQRPVVVCAGARLVRCLLQQGCTAENECFAQDCMLFEGAALGVRCRVFQSVLGPDASLSGGECHHSLLGPFLGFHHHSLLIATIWPMGRGNIGYGAMIGANHSGRVNDQECWVGEGCFFGLGCSLRFPANLVDSPYSIVTPGTAMFPQIVRFPFSVIGSAAHLVGDKISPDACRIIPGFQLYANPYMIERSASKFKSRRKSKLHNTSFALIRPSLIRRVLCARSRLRTGLARFEGAEGHHMIMEGQSSVGGISGLGKCVTTVRDAHKALHAYNDLIRRYALHGLFWLIVENPALKVVAAFLDEARSIESDKIEEGVFTSMMNNLQLDIDCYKEHLTCSPSLAQAIASGICITDFHVRSVCLHQLSLLLSEHLLLTSSASAEASGLSEAMIRQTLEPLAHLELAYADAVAASRKKDVERGSGIIPDYLNVNSAAKDVMDDTVVSAAYNRSQYIADTLSRFRFK